MAGVLLGPFGIGALFTEQDAQQVLHFAEFGVVLLLFLIGLELRPKRLWAMRQAIFGLGTAQVHPDVGRSRFHRHAVFRHPMAAVAVRRRGAGVIFDGIRPAGDGRERRAATRHGRLGFSVLLFQDLAAIPLIALAPYFAVSATTSLRTSITLPSPRDWRRSSPSSSSDAMCSTLMLRLVALSESRRP